MENGFRIGGSHYVDPSLNTITGPDGPTRLEPKVMQVLVCLTAHAGEVVTKDRLMRTVWPDTFVGDDVLTRAISELRRVFGDDAKEPRVIQTIPKSGYRLIAGLSSEARETLAERRQGPAEASVLPARRTKRRKPVLILVGTVLLAAVAISGWWIASPRQAPSEPPRQPAVTQLTANPPDLPVTSARVSPDGKYLAYADPTGIQVRVIDTGETQRIAETRGMDVYAWSGDGTKIRTAACDSATCTGWDISLVGGTRRRSGAVWPVTDFVISTPDGSRLLRITNSSRELWIDLVDGSAPRRLVDLGQNGSANWSADGERVLFTRGDTPSTVESMPLAGGSPSVVFKADEGHRLGHTEPPIGMFLESRDGSLLMLLSDTQTNAVAVWEIPIDRSSGVARGSPRRLTEGTPDRASVGAFSGSWILNASSDGRRVVLRSDTSHGDIYVARFDERQGRLLDPPRRLTSDERGSFPGAWTPDGKAILFNSGQSGTQDIFTLSLNDESAEPLVAGPGDQVLPRMSSDGQWVLFLVQPTGAERWRVMRVPLAGGRPEQVLARAGLVWPRCSIVGRCVLLEKDRDGWIISSLDPVRGKGERLFSLPFDIRGGDLSPDGNALAFVLEGSRPRNRIRIYSLGGEPQQDVVVENASTLVGLDWAATGAGLFSSNVTPGLSELLFIRLDGTSHVLWSQRGTPVWAVPSPDGAHLAIGGLTRQSNIWMLTDF